MSLFAEENLGRDIRDIITDLNCKKIDEAFKKIEAYLEKDPDHFLVRLTKAEIFTEQGKYQEALKIYNELEGSYPKDPKLLISLGKFYILTRSFVKAINCLETYVQQGDKTCIDTCFSLLASAYGQNGDFNRAIFYSKLIQDTAKQRLAEIHCGLMLPHIYSSAAVLSSHRQRIERNLEQIVSHEEAWIGSHQSDVPLIFNVAYQGYNDKDFNSKYSDYIRKSLKALPLKEQVYSPPHPEGKIRIGFISALYHFHTIGKLTAGIIHLLPRSKYEVVLILTNRRSGDIITERMKALVDKVVYLDEPASGIEQMNSLHLDILFYSDIGMDQKTYLLAHHRLAPVQCVTWGHPVTTGISTIDYFISSKLLEVSDAQEHYREKLVLLDLLPVFYYTVPEALYEGKGLLPIPEGAHVYSCPQTLFKIHPEFDSWIEGILKEDPKGIAVFIDRGDAMKILLTQRFKRVMSKDVMDRVLFVPQMSQVEYFTLLSLSDVILDPIHFGGGNSSFEAFAVGTPVVTCPFEYMRGRVTSGCYRQMGISQCIAKSRDEYISIALKLAMDERFRHYVRKRIQLEKSKLFENFDVIKELDTFFQKAVTENCAGRVV